MPFLALFITLPTKASTGRMRVWRALKALGCATLRDGVYLLPDSAEHALALAEIAAEAIAVKGSGDIYRLVGYDEAQDSALQALFNRAEEYAAVAGEIRELKGSLMSLDGATAARKLQAVARRVEQLAQIDFFPGEAQRQTRDLLDEARAALARYLSPDEPTARQADIPHLDHADYRGRIWATRARPWVDRLASAWLIRRYIDPGARIVWLAQASDCKAGWLGFDFDGAAFSHVGARVTFETLLASFGLQNDAALVRLGELVHCLDVGGLPVLQAPGIESLLAGLRVSEPDDDALLAQACKVFDWLLKSYEDKIM